jgi:hypothetical protein
MRWARAELCAQPMLHTVHDLIQALPADSFPTYAALNALAAQHDVRSGDDAPIRFVPPLPVRSAQAYEELIFQRGEVQTRPDNWHDLFNAFAWLAFPRSKAMLNRLHIAHLAQQIDTRRSASRDVLTLFDEDGMIVLSAEPELSELLRAFRWKELFVERRAQVRQSMRFYIFGHALHEKALQPFKGITGKALIVDAGALAPDPADSRAAIDACVETALRQPLNGSAALQPLPILGIPGWWAPNESPAYYEDTRQFRPGRRRDL